MEHGLTRRGLLGAAAGTAALGALGPFARTALGETGCPAPVAGSVTRQTGTIDRAPLGSVDAFTDADPPVFQRQLFSVLSSVPGAADRYCANQVVAGERWLLLNQIAARPGFGEVAEFSTGTFTIGQSFYDADGTQRTVAATFQKFGKSCGYTSKDASAGTVVYTTVTAELVEGTYDLWFRGDRVQGRFSAPRVVLCEPRPSNRTCLRA